MQEIRVLVVHGCCHGRDPVDQYVPIVVGETHRALEAARPGGKFSVSVPFYGALLDQYARQLLFADRVDADVLELAQAFGLPSDLTSLQQLQTMGLPGDLTSFHAWGSDLGGGAEGGAQPFWLPELARKILFATSHRDVAAYQTNDEAREAVWSRVAEAWRGFGPHLVIAHSLGSVVAWEMLVNRRPLDIEVPFLLTIGSPLGGQHIIQDRLRGERSVGVGVKHWQNFNDPGDLYSDGEWLIPDGFAVNEETQVDNPSWNSHDYGGYLFVRDAMGPLTKLVERIVA